VANEGKSAARFCFDWCYATMSVNYAKKSFEKLTPVGGVWGEISCQIRLGLRLCYQECKLCQKSFVTFTSALLPNDECDLVRKISLGIIMASRRQDYCAEYSLAFSLTNKGSRLSWMTENFSPSRYWHHTEHLLCQDGIKQPGWTDWAIFHQLGYFCRLIKETAQKWQYLGLQIYYIFT
jgi:hypothetical protein